MGTELPEWVHGALSAPRFDRYRNAAQGDVDAALRLYQWNIDVSSAFFGPLHWLEVGLRNALNERLRAHFGRVDWWSVARLNANGRRKIDQAMRKLTNKDVRVPSADDVVAELTFGFWVSLLSRVNDREFWVPALHKAFPHYSGPRNHLHYEMSRMLDFRNRIMHHEPVFDRDLVAYRQRILRLLGFLSPFIVEHAQRHDRAVEVLDRRGLGGEVKSAADS